MTDSGWIKLHRSLMGKAFYSNDSEKVHLWVHLMLCANHSGREEFFAGKPIICKSGQFTTGRKQLSEQTGISESKIERILTYFEKIEQQIEQQKSSTNRLISILNWSKYQVSEQQIEQRVNNDRTTTEQRVNNEWTHYNNFNNGNNVKNEIIVNSGEFLQNSPPHAQFSIFNETTESSQILNETIINDKEYQNENKIEIKAQNNAQNESNSFQGKSNAVFDTELQCRDSNNDLSGVCEIKETKKDYKKLQLSDIDGEVFGEINKKHLEIALSFQALIRKNIVDLGGSAKDIDATKGKAIDTIRLMFEADKFKLEDMQAVYCFLRDEVPKGEFSWKKNILSISKLRQQFNKLLIDANNLKKNATTKQSNREATTWSELAAIVHSHFSN